MENEVMHIKLKFKEGLKHYIQINDIDSVITDDGWIKKWQNIVSQEMKCLKQSIKLFELYNFNISMQS